MRFPLIDKLILPCVFERAIPGRLHRDGRRYLPLIALRQIRPTAPDDVTPAGMLLGVVDRHHRVDLSAIGRAGVARLVFALSELRLQQPPFRVGLEPESGWATWKISTAPTLFGQVAEVAVWERGNGHLPYQTLYTELVIDAGVGTVGLRTSLTAQHISAAIGGEIVTPGDYVELRHSRIDILSFEPADSTAGPRPPGSYEEEEGAEE